MAAQTKPIVFRPPASAPFAKPGPLEKTLGHHLPLTYSERDALRALERREVQAAAGDIVMRENEEADRLYVVASGWLHGSVQLADGNRQILRFYFVGDLTGDGPVAWGRASSTLTAVSDCRLYAVDRASLGRTFREHPRLAMLFYAIGAGEQVAMAKRLTSVGRTDALHRIGTLLLELRDRLEVVDGDSGAVFQLPLTLQDLGDATGLTKTHAGRILRKLEEDGMLERDGRMLRILDITAFGQLVGYAGQPGRIATGWMA